MTSKKQDWRGRPRKPAASKLSKSLTVKVTEAEYEQLTQAAIDAEKTMSDFCRKLIKKELDK